MTEMTKTMAFLGTAVVALVGAWFSRPAPATFDANVMVGTKLYEFDPLTARRLKVVRFNSLTGEPQEFEVAKVGNTWAIPSKNNYPADAEDQMAEAASAVNDKEVLRIAAEDARNHQLYGVLDPTSSDRKVGEEGVGTKVTILDDAGKELANLIIGKEDKDKPEHRFVRPAGRDIVLVAEIDPDKLSTDFADWIEKDLLKLNAWDVAKVHVKDYSFEAVPVLTPQGIQFSPEWTHKADMTLAYNDTDSKWNAESLLVYDPATQQYVEKPLGENEEINTQTVNDLKSALDDLRIVDVGKKPDGLSANLQATEEFLQTSNREAIESLFEHGFAPMRNQDGTLELTSTEGEVIVTMKTGVEYVLRFGEVAIDGDSAAQAGAPPEDNAADAEAESGGNLNRYIFVVARFNEGAIEKPEFETPPDLPEGVEAAEAAAAGDAAQTQPADAATNGSTDAENAAAETAEDAASGDAPADDAADASAEGDAAAATEDADTTEAAETDGEQSETEKILAERKRIEEENQRKRDEYEAKITKGKETVQELNERFGDWYYVIDNAEYKRIHLGRDQIVKAKEAETAEGADPATGSESPAADAGGPALPSLPDSSNEQAEPAEVEDEPTETQGDAAGDSAAAGESDSDQPAPTQEPTTQSAAADEIGP
jgi:hypothetical protein